MIVIALANAIVGLLVGMCGVAGFLLPMLYAGFLGYTPTEALAFSFVAFVISGSLGALNYYRVRLLNVRLAAMISLGSLVGALAGVRLNLWLPTSLVTTILYLVVFMSGIAIFVQQRRGGLSAHANSPLLHNRVFLLGFGCITGMLCALSGAGGPVLVMPLLVMLGVEPHIAVGVGLLNSVAISGPAAIGYLSQIQIGQFVPLLLIVVVAHGIGVGFGSWLGPKINAQWLKFGTACFAVVIAVYKLAGAWFA